ncbi:hypothetical protein V490_06165 [Pseudogymnoascus sp. VKM F-3557]|nr:hypothetical protein V490_06165 [Pseudogymnoascus sp. VKM F-3557]
MLWGLENFFFTKLSPYLAQGRVINLPQRLMLFGLAPTFLSVFCIAASVRQSYVRTRVQRFFPGATGPVAALAAALSATTTAAAAVAAPAQPYRLKPLIRSDFDYHTTWPSYDRGKIFYSSLSGSIHSFGSAYEVDDSNWLSSDAAILALLRPNGPVDATTKEVVWGDEWVTEKGLPA